MFGLITNVREGEKNCRECGWVVRQGHASFGDEAIVET